MSDRGRVEKPDRSDELTEGLTSHSDEKLTENRSPIKREELSVQRLSKTAPELVHPP